MSRCTFCQNEGELHEVEAPAIRLCSTCREKLGTHIAVVCTGCDTVFWLRKTPENVARAAGMSDLSPLHIRENYIMHQISHCKRCLNVVKEFTAESKWVQ